MAIRSVVSVCLAALALSACAGVETSSRNVTLDSPLVGAPAAVTRDYAVTEVRVEVPQALHVSEANSYYPITDIVWRGDPMGDRHAQIAALFDTAADRVMPGLDGSVPVVALIQLERFHGVTERTRYSVGGTYNVIFQITVVDARTGEVVEPARQVEANLPAPGGNAAIALEQSGQTERVRMIDFLSFVLARELGPRTVPGGPEPLAL